MTRFAGLSKVLPFLRNAMAPQGATTGAKVFDAAMSYGPDLAFAGLSAATAPGGFNPGVGLEDLGISLAGTALGRVGGKALGKKFFPDDLDAQQRTQMATEFALGVPVHMLTPRPLLDAAIEGEMRSQQARQEAQAASEEDKLVEQMLLGLLTTGGMVSPGPLTGTLRAI